MYLYCKVSYHYKNFARATTAQLSCHAQNFIAITLRQLGSHENEIPIEFVSR